MISYVCVLYHFGDIVGFFLKSSRGPELIYFEGNLHCVPKKMDHQTHGGNFVKILTDFQNPFTVRVSDKFAIKVIVKDPTTP